MNLSPAEQSKILTALSEQYAPHSENADPEKHKENSVLAQKLAQLFHVVGRLSQSHAPNAYSMGASYPDDRSVPAYRSEITSGYRRRWKQAEVAPGLWEQSGTTPYRVFTVAKEQSKLVTLENLKLPFVEVGIDSLDAVEFVMAIEEEFAIEISDNDADSFRTVYDVASYLMGRHE